MSGDPSVMATEFKAQSLVEQLNSISRHCNKKCPTAVSGYVKLLKQEKQDIPEDLLHNASSDDNVEEYPYQMGKGYGTCVLTLGKLILRLDDDSRVRVEKLSSQVELRKAPISTGWRTWLCTCLCKVLTRAHRLIAFVNTLRLLASVPPSRTTPCSALTTLRLLWSSSRNQDEQASVASQLDNAEQYFELKHWIQPFEHKLPTSERLKRLQTLCDIELPIDDILKIDFPKSPMLQIHTKENMCYRVKVASDENAYKSLEQTFNGIRKFRTSTWILLFEHFLVYVSNENKIEKLDFHDMYSVAKIKDIDQHIRVLGVNFKTGNTFQKLFIGCNDVIHKWIQNAKITQTERLLLDKHSAPFDGRLLTLGKDGFSNLKRENDFKSMEAEVKSTTTAFTHQRVPGFGIKLHMKTHARLDKNMGKNALMAARLRHFAIVPVYAAFLGPGESITFISACFNLENLRNILDYGHVDMETRLRMLYHVSCAIEFLHTPVNPYRGIVLHLDISSANIVLDENFNARLIDFGSSRELPEGKTSLPNENDSPLGRTPGYYPDGRIRALDKSLDYFSFAVVMREVLTGENPAAEKCKHDASLKSYTLCKCFNFQRSIWQYVIDKQDIDSLRRKAAEDLSTEILNEENVPMSNRPNDDNIKSENSMSDVSTTDGSITEIDRKKKADRRYMFATKLIVTSKVMHVLETTNGGFAHRRGFEVVKLAAEELKRNKIIWDESLIKFLKEIEQCFRQKHVTEGDSFNHLANLLLSENLKRKRTGDEEKTLESILTSLTGFDEMVLQVLKDKINEPDKSTENSVDDTVVVREAANVVNMYLKMNDITRERCNLYVFESVDRLSMSCFKMNRERHDIDVSSELWNILDDLSASTWKKPSEIKRMQMQPENVVPATSCDVCLLNEATKVENIVRHKSNCKGINLCITCIKNHYFNPLCCPGVTCRCNDCQPDIGGNGVRFLCVSGDDTNDPAISKQFKSNAQKIQAVFSSKVHHTLSISSSKIQTLHAPNQLHDIKRVISQPTDRCETLVLYYCGHGGEKGKGEEKLQVTDEYQITQTDLKQLPDVYSASKFIAVLDCCYAPEIKNDKPGLTVLQINSSKQDKIKSVNSQFTDALTQALFKSHDNDKVPQFDPTVEVINMTDLKKRTICLDMPDQKIRTSCRHEDDPSSLAAFIQANTSNQNVSFCSLPYVDILVVGAKVENKKIRIYWHANWEQVLDQVQSDYVFETDWLQEQCRDAVILRNDIDASGKEIGTIQELWKALEQKRLLCVDLRRIHDFNHCSPKRIVIYEPERIPFGERYTSSQIKILRDLNADKRKTEKPKEPSEQYTKVEVIGNDVIALMNERNSRGIASLKQEDGGGSSMHDQNKDTLGGMLPKILTSEAFQTTISTLCLEFYFDREGCSSGEHRLGLVIGVLPT